MGTLAHLSCAKLMEVPGLPLQQLRRFLSSELKLEAVPVWKRT